MRGGAAIRSPRFRNARSARMLRPDALEEPRDRAGSPDPPPEWRRASPDVSPERRSSRTPLIFLEAPGSEKAPRAKIRGATGSSLVQRCGSVCSLSPTLDSVRFWRRFVRADESETSVSLSPQSRALISLYAANRSDSIGIITQWARKFSRTCRRTRRFHHFDSSDISPRGTRDRSAASSGP